MIEVKNEVYIKKPISTLLNYFMDPKNIMKQIPYFKEIHQTGENTFQVKFKWLFSLDFDVLRIYNKFNNEILYIIKREKNIKVKGELHHILSETKDGSRVLIRFIYEGPFEFLVKRQAMKFMSNLSDKLFEDVQVKVEHDTNNINLKSFKHGIINKEKLEEIMDLAAVESVGSILQLILSDGENIVKITFIDGEVKDINGDINSLKNNIKFVIKKKE
jgi:hypothetical protein